MKKHLLFLILLSFILFAGCTEQTKWNKFIWANYSYEDQHYDKAAILIPFKFDGLDEEYYVQLDTGATSVLNGNSFKDIKAKYNIISRENQKSSVLIDGSLVDYKFKDKYFRIKQNYGPTLEILQKAEYKKIGNLGLDFLKEQILILDFPNERFTIVKSKKEIPEDIKQNSTFLDIEILNNKLYLNSKIGDKNLSLFYDTGASIFPIVTTKDTWTDLVKNPNAKPEKVLNVPSWGKNAQLIGARAKDDWVIGEITIENPLIFCETSELNNLNFETIGADGLIGNAIFYDNFIITIDLINNKFGIMEVESIGDKE